MSLEQTTSKSNQSALPFFIGEKEFHWHTQYITGQELRQLVPTQADDVILLAIKRPWDDEIIENDTRVDLARPGIENFIVHKRHEHVMVDISIDGNVYSVKRGKHSVAQLKNVGQVPAEYELEELIDGKLTPLDDHATVLIKGNEKFYSHVRDGRSS